MTKISVENRAATRRVSVANYPLTRLRRLDILYPVGLFFLVLASRLIFPSHYLYHWDSVNFAYSIRDYNLALEQPQPPGYILYVGLIRLVDTVVHSPQTTMVSISILSSSLAAAFLYELGKQMFNRRVGLLASILLVSSPLFWFYGEIALPHTLDALLVIVSAWFFFRVMRGEGKLLLPAVLVLALAGGVRQQTLVFLLPLALFSIRRQGWRGVLYAGVTGAAACLAWLMPLLIFSGGLSNYLHVMGTFSTRFQTTTSIFSAGGLWGLRRNLIKLSMYTLYGVGFGLASAAVIPFLKRTHWVKAIHDERTLFLALWILPALLYYTFIHMGQQGLVFVYLPALLLGCGRFMDFGWEHYPKAVLGAVVAISLAHAGIFILAPEHPIGTDQVRLLTRDTILNSDRYFGERFSAIQNQFPPETTIILANNWRHVQYYLPQYRVIPFNLGSKWEVDQDLPNNQAQDRVYASPRDLGIHPGSDGVVNLVQFDENLNQYNRTPTGIKKIPLTNGYLEYQAMTPSDHLIMETDFYEIAPK